MRNVKDIIEDVNTALGLCEAWNCPIGPNVKIGGKVQKVVWCSPLNHRTGYDRMANFSHNIRIAGVGKPKEYYYSNDGKLYWYKNHSSMPMVDFVDLGGKEQIPDLKDILKPAFLKRMGGGKDYFWSKINFGMGLNEPFRPKTLKDRLAMLRSDIVSQLASETGISGGTAYSELKKFVDDIPDAKLIKFTGGRLVTDDVDGLDEAKQILPVNFLSMQSDAENKKNFLKALQNAKVGTAIKDSKGRVLFQKIDRNQWNWFNETKGVILMQTDDSGVFGAVQAHTSDVKEKAAPPWPSMVSRQAGSSGKALTMEALEEAKNPRDFFHDAKKGDKFKIGDMEFVVKGSMGYVEPPADAVSSTTSDKPAHLLLVAYEAGDQFTTGKGGYSFILDVPSSTILVYPWSKTKTDSRGEPKPGQKSTWVAKTSAMKIESLDEGYHGGDGKFSSGYDGARLYSRDGQRFRIVTREGRHWKVPVRGRLRSQMTKAERRRLEMRDERRKKLEKKTRLPEGYNSAVDEFDATENPVERESFYAQVIESVTGERVELPKKKWVDTSMSKLSEDQIERLWKLYSISYEEIGMTVKDISHMRNKYKLLWLIDIDEDADPDAFIIYKDTKFGKKLSLIGHDGSSQTKSAVVEKAVNLLKTRGWYTGASGKPAKIMLAKGAPTVSDPHVIETVFQHKFIRHVGKGQYEVEVGRGGNPKKVVKSMFGNPIVREEIGDSGLDEGTPTWMKRCVASVAKQYGGDTSKAFAICTAQGQKSGMLKPGTGKPTAKGTNRAKSMGQDPGHKSKLGSYEKMLKGKRKKKEGVDGLGEGLSMNVAVGAALKAAMDKAAGTPRYTPTISDVEMACKADHRKIYDALKKEMNPPAVSRVERIRWHPGELDVRLVPSGTVLKYRLALDGVWRVTVISGSGKTVTRPVGNHGTNDKKIARKTVKLLKKMGVATEEVKVMRNLKIGPYGLLEDTDGLVASWFDGTKQRSGEIVDSYVHPRLSTTFVRVETGSGKRIDVPAYAIQVEMMEQLDDDDDVLEEEVQSGPDRFLELYERAGDLLDRLAPVDVKFGTVSVDEDGNRVWEVAEAAAVRSMIQARKVGIQKMRGVKAEVDKLIKGYGIRSVEVSYDVQLVFGEVEYTLKNPAVSVFVVYDEVGRYFKLKGGWWLEIKGQVNGADIAVKEHIGKPDDDPRRVAKAAEKFLQVLSG